MSRLIYLRNFDKKFDLSGGDYSLKAKWNEFVKILGYLFLVIGVWMVLFGGRIQLGNPLRFFE